VALDNHGAAGGRVRKTAVLILDGLGLSESAQGSAVTRRTMPYLYSLMDAHGCAVLEASGSAVGLDDGQAGNSEVGHLTIGAGRLVPTTLNRIRAAFANGEWQRHDAWAGVRGAERVHVAGLLSEAGVHAHWSSLTQTVELAARQGAREVFLHLFLDGVDSPAGTAPALLAQLQRDCGHLPNVHIATISGRRWACDRSGDRATSDHCRSGLFGELERIPFDLDRLHDHIRKTGSEASFPFHDLRSDGVVRDGEPILITHHRADRTRQLAASLGERAELYSLVQLGEVVPEQRVFFPTRPLEGGLLQVLAQQGIVATRVAERCKFPHVTHFINGLRDDVPGLAIEIPSIPEVEIPHQPQMSLAALQSCAEQRLAAPEERALVINIPNLDQVGHTGDLRLAEQAAMHVDRALGGLCQRAAACGWNLVITADHGNADRMLDEQGRPVGSHSTNPVPLLILGASGEGLRLRRNRGTLANVAPTFLAIAGMGVPEYMDETLVDVQTRSTALTA